MVFVRNIHAICSPHRKAAHPHFSPLSGLLWLQVGSGLGSGAPWRMNNRQKQKPNLFGEEEVCLAQLVPQEQYTYGHFGMTPDWVMGSPGGMTGICRPFSSKIREFEPPPPRVHTRTRARVRKIK